MKITRLEHAPGAIEDCLAMIEYHYDSRMYVLSLPKTDGGRWIRLKMPDDRLMHLEDAIELVEVLQAAIDIAKSVDKEQS